MSTAWLSSSPRTARTILALPSRLWLGLHAISRLGAGMVLWASCVAVVWSEEVSDAARPTPATRPEMKQVLEDLKQRPLRIPLPESAAQAEDDSHTSDTDAGRRQAAAESYETELRAAYLPAWNSMAGYGFLREPDPKMTLDYVFKTEMFWIVSRTNNCHYCLGHQEIKLALAGQLEDQIAALDSNWLLFSPAQQAAFAFARQLTHQPWSITSEDVDRLRPHFNELQILEMILSLAGNNAINRWKEGAGIPQEPTAARFVARQATPVPQNRPLPITSFLTPTSPEFTEVRSQVAALEAGPAPPRLSAAEVSERLAAARQRTPRIGLLSEAETRQVLGDLWPADRPLPAWMRLLAHFPVHGKARIAYGLSVEREGDLPPLTKAQMSAIIALQDGAWYALAEAQGRLQGLGQSEEQIQQLQGDWSQFSEGDRVLFRLARNLAASPIRLTDKNVADALAVHGPRMVVQAINYTTDRASFDRITEAAGLAAD